jgi:hypothetical protein
MSILGFAIGKLLSFNEIFNYGCQSFAFRCPTVAVPLQYVLAISPMLEVPNGGVLLLPFGEVCSSRLILFFGCLLPFLAVAVYRC